MTINTDIALYKSDQTAPFSSKITNASFQGNDVEEPTTCSSPKICQPPSRPTGYKVSGYRSGGNREKKGISMTAFEFLQNRGSVRSTTSPFSKGPTTPYNTKKNVDLSSKPMALNSHPLKRSDTHVPAFRTPTNTPNTPAVEREAIAYPLTPLPRACRWPTIPLFPDNISGGSGTSWEKAPTC